MRFLDGNSADGFWRDQRVLVIAPHPDDETFGCGGLMAKVKGSGGQVYVMVGSVGDLYHYGTEPVTAASVAYQGGGPSLALVTASRRADELSEAMATLEVDGYEILFTEPGRHLRLDAMPQADLIALIERDARYAMDRIAPTVVVLPAASYNQDHDALFRAGFAACRPHLASQKPFVSLVLEADAPQLGWHYRPFQPNFYVDIGEHLNTKLRAHQCHRSQLKPPPHLASLENVERMARVRGAEVGIEAAEAFRCYRQVT
jgi:LmbE family N-acetylglucosaminyl deacetylase